MADDLVVFRDPVKRAGALRTALQLSNAGGGPSEGRQKLTCVVARGRKTRVQRRERSRCLGSGNKAEHGRSAGDRLSQHAVARGWLNELARERLERGVLRQSFDQVGEGHPVGLDEHEVEGDGRGPCLHKPLREIGNQRAWPGPLTEARERWLVNVDDAHGNLRVVLTRL